MVICQTPLRVSFFGGGTDFPEFFREHGGAVLATAIDKCIYHSVNHFHSDLFDYSIRLAARRVECVKSLDEIEHAPFREILRHYNVTRDVEVNLAADLPSFSGLGSSSSFTVGMINAVNAFKGTFVAKQELANQAIRIERDVLHESVGLQDQVTAAYGGLNVIEFSGQDRFTVSRVSISKDKMAELGSSLMLFFTGLVRRANEVEKNKLSNLSKNKASLKRMLEQVEEGHKLLTGNGSLAGFGKLLDTAWKEKRALDPGVTAPAIDEMYERARKGGALGGKLLGAGGGGFMLVFAPPERQAKVRKALKGFSEVAFQINAPGSRIIHS
jgi:D-glycero-alpha-D-manno-heptose-7-phosphate kinase